MPGRPAYAGNPYAGCQRLRGPYSDESHQPHILWSRSLGGGSYWEDARGGNIRAELGLDRFYFNGGDTAGMAARADGVFHPFWIDNRTGVPQIWTAAVTVNGKALVNGSAELADMIDISSLVTLEFKNVLYDQQKGVINFDVSVTNTSKGPLTGPIKARVLSGLPRRRGRDSGKRRQPQSQPDLGFREPHRWPPVGRR